MEDGDIVNVDVTVYYKGVHGKISFSLILIFINPNLALTYQPNHCLTHNAGDLNETFFVGNVDEESKKLVQCTYECLEKAISIGMYVTINVIFQLCRLQYVKFRGLK